MEEHKTYMFYSFQNETQNNYWESENCGIKCFGDVLMCLEMHNESRSVEELSVLMKKKKKACRGWMECDSQCMCLSG